MTYKKLVFLLLTIVLFSLFYISCKKDHATPLQSESFLKIDNIVFNTKSSNNLKDHFFNIDTLNYSPYTLSGSGIFAGKSRSIEFKGGGFYQGVPVIEFSGWDDFGYTYIAKDTSGSIIELYRKKFSSSVISFPLPITVFASKNLIQGETWESFSGWEQGRNTLYATFKTTVISTNSISSTGIAGCIEFENSSPDFIDTIFIKPGKGPVEIRSWRAHLYETNQPGIGAYK